MSDRKANPISKKELLDLKEDNVLFITNPGRMGDEDGVTFIVRQDNKYSIYRIDGLMYPNLEEKEQITLNDILSQFPKWQDAWKNGDNKKYKYIYMGFGNGLSVDNSIYSEFEPYLNKLVEEDLASVSEEEKEKLKYATIYNVWETAFIQMMKEKKER